MSLGKSFPCENVGLLLLTINVFSFFPPVPPPAKAGKAGAPRALGAPRRVSRQGRQICRQHLPCESGVLENASGCWSIAAHLWPMPISRDVWGLSMAQEPVPTYSFFGPLLWSRTKITEMDRGCVRAAALCYQRIVLLTYSLLL